MFRWIILFALATVATVPHRAQAVQAGESPRTLGRTAPDANHWRPTWSPDGTEIAYSALDADRDYELYVVTVATGAVRQLTDNSHRDWRPKWSPDGRLIAFSSDRDGNGELYTIDPRSEHTTRLTETESDEDRMSWSPDNRRLVYDAGNEGEWNLWILDLDTGERRQLTNEPGFEGYPDWSPDAATITFNSNLHDPAGGSMAREIYLLDLASGARTRLTENTANDQSPAWSPDGRRIAYFSARDGNFEIYVMNADGTDQTRITHDPEWDFMPAWARDGTRIAFDSRRDGRRAIYTMKPDGSDVRKITNLRMSPFIERARESGINSAIVGFDAAVAAGGDADAYFLDVEVLALARAVADSAPLAQLQLLETNLRAHPRSLLGWTSFGDALRRLGLRRTARGAYLEALAIDPRHAPALAGLQETAIP